MPLNIERKTYTGGYENAGFIETFSYGEDNTCIVNVSDTGASLSFKYAYNDGLMIIERLGEGQEKFEAYERCILPEVIRLGETWNDLYSSKMITGVEVDIETIWGTQKAIEVTTFFDTHPDFWGKSYYTKELGEVYTSYYGLADKLVEVELIQ